MIDILRTQKAAKMSESKIFGYARVSTKDQNLDRQIDALKKYVPDERDILIEKFTGRSMERPVYQTLRNNMLRGGDTLYVTSLDRLGRDKAAIQDELQYYREIGVFVRILDVPTTLMDFSQYGTLQKAIMDMVNNILIEVLGTMAEQEITIKRKRQREGIDAAKARGKHLGRPRATYPDNWQEVYATWRRKEITAREAMRRMGLKPSTFYKLAKQTKS